MKNVVYYFSGTGNSLVIARDIVRELGGGEVVSIARLSREEIVSTDADAVGIVYPVYAFGLPLIVERFISKLKVKEGQYVFTVANYGLIQGAGITRAHRLLRKMGIKPKAGFGITMPNNYTPFGEALPKDKQDKLFIKEKEKAREIAECVRKKETVPVETGFFLGRWFLTEPIGAISSRFSNNEDKKFLTNEKCNGCGICSKVCPVGNIERRGGKPLWKHHCEQCLACFHWCPEEAIEIGKSTKGKKRYRNPEVTLQDIL